MSDTHPPTQRFIRLYVTAAFTCSYLPERFARSQVAEPAVAINADNYGELVRAGFRRSGRFTYRPRCDNCRACIPVRIPVNQFRPNRSQRRAARRHSDLISRNLPLAFRDEHYALYIRYQQARHNGSDMHQDDEEQYREYLLQSRVDTRLVEFRAADSTLLMVSIIDVLDDGLSAVYTFFEPNMTGSSLGTYGILWQVRMCQILGLSYLYLGYWINEAPSMRYKSNFRPLEQQIDGTWTLLKD
ncbi:MAG: arginyltransferase [Lautropia sp.]|nr:arginyltransferase [Lautropia sp.]